MQRQVAIDPRPIAIGAYIDWYRERYEIKVGDRQVDGGELSELAQMIESLARSAEGTGEWWVVYSELTLVHLYAYIARRVSHLHATGEVVVGWPTAEAWQLSPDVLTVLEYVWYFRYAHKVDLNNPREFRYDDLGPMGELVIGELVNAPDFTGAWSRLEDLDIAAAAAKFTRDVRSRLEPYMQRRQEQDGRK